MTSNTIYIIGAGAIGKALAVLLTRASKSVILLRGSVSGESSRKELIEVEMNDGSVWQASVEMGSIENYPELNGIILLTNKSYGNKDLAKRLKNKTKDSPLVLLQNGLGIEQPFVEENFPVVYRCVLFATSQNVTDQRVRYKTVSQSPIGVIKGGEDRLGKVVEQINSSHFPFREESHIQEVIWKKAIMNCVFNSICPLIETDNGIFHRNAKVAKMADNVIEECVAVADKVGVKLQVEDIRQGVQMISKSSDGQFISTLQDIRSKRETEIDTLNIEVVRLAEKLGLGDKVKQTRLLGDLTLLKSELSR